jgi:hypothetical protein
VRPRRDFQALEERRQQAAKLFGGGEILASVARTLQVSRQSVSPTLTTGGSFCRFSAISYR